MRILRKDKIMKRYKNSFVEGIRQAALKKYFYLFLTAIVVAMTSFIYFRDKPMIRSNDDPEIRLICVDYKKDGIYGTLDLSKNEISKDLNDCLLSILKNVKIRNRLLPAIKSHTVLEGDTHITVKVDLDNSSLFVNLHNDSQFSSAQFNDRHYHIVNSENVYEDVYRLVSDLLMMEK